MGIFDSEINLPGTFTQVEADYSYGYDPSLFGTTDSVLIIGTAFNGPVGVPTKVYSVEHAVYIFGSAYNSTTRREASLVEGIQDAWDRGCRTIYAVRIGGIDMYKDFNLRIDSQYKLRLSSMFPTDVSKDCYFTFDNTVGAEELTIYKPAERATIAEKKRGSVTSSTAVLTNTLRIASDYGYSRNDRLVDLINTFNSNSNNNVLKLSIVNAEGVDVTTSSEVYSLPIGVLYPGVYFLGRSSSAIEEHNEIKFCIRSNDDSDPYDNMSESYYKTLTFNTDVSLPYPIYASGSNLNKFRELLAKVNISATSKTTWDFLKTYQMPDRAFTKDSTDYEETDLSEFDIYQRLGSGYAITAKATMRTKVDAEGNKVETTPRITETPTSDANRVTPIIEGIYNTLENIDIKYRVLACANADQTIDGKLPRAKDFKKAFATTAIIADNKIALTPVIESNDFSDKRSYKVTINPVDSVSHWNERESVYTGEVFPVVCIADKTFEELQKEFKANNKVPTVTVGEQFFVKTDDVSQFELVRSTENGPVRKNDPTIYTGKNFIANGKLYVGTVPPTGTTVVFTEATIGVDTADSYVDDLEKPIADANGKVSGEEGWIPTYEQKLVPGVDASKFTVGDIDYEYVLGSMNDTVFAYQVKNGALEPVGTYATTFATEDEETISIYAEDFPFGTNSVIISSSLFDSITLTELVEAINEHTTLGAMFTAEVLDDAQAYVDGILTDIIDLSAPIVSDVFENKYISYDYSLYIPYRTNDTFGRQLAQHCTYTELKTAPAYGFIGCKRLMNTTLSNIANKVTELVNTNFDLYAKNNYGHNMLDSQSLPYPIGKNVSIVFSQYSDTMSNDDFSFKSNGAAGYAGMVSTLPLDQSSTLQAIDIDSIDFSLSQNQLNQLTSVGIVTMRDSYTKGIVVTDGVTMAPSDSVFRRLASSRIVGACEDLIRSASESYIGKQNHAANRNALKTAIKGNLDKIVGTLIEDFEFNLVDVSANAKLSYISIDYKIVPIYEIREIRNNIKITDSLSSSSTTTNS